MLTHEEHPETHNEDRKNDTEVRIEEIQLPMVMYTETIYTSKGTIAVARIRVKRNFFSGKSNLANAYPESRGEQNGYGRQRGDEKAVENEPRKLLYGENSLIVLQCRASRKNCRRNPENLLSCLERGEKHPEDGTQNAQGPHNEDSVDEDEGSVEGFSSFNRYHCRPP
jgi:hypothetical protein